MAASTHNQPDCSSITSLSLQRAKRQSPQWTQREFLLPLRSRYKTEFPRTELDIAKVEAAGPEDVDAAVQAAHKALKDPSWKLLPATDRGMLMSRLADLLEQNKELLATIDAWDNGRCRSTLSQQPISDNVEAKHTPRL